MAEKKEETITVTLSVLEELIAARTRQSIVDFMTSKTPDERMSDQMDLQRGKNRPTAPESLVHCKSPMTGSTFTARLIKSRQFPNGRIVEMLDYVRPDGWDRKKIDGGLYHDGEEWPLRQSGTDPKPGEPHHRFTRWVYDSFWRKDWLEINGKPESFLDAWKVSRAA